MLGRAQTLDGLRRIAQHLASFVAVERPRKAKNQANQQSGLTVRLGTGLSCLVDLRAAGQASSEVVRGYPSGIASDIAVGHGTGTRLTPGASFPDCQATNSSFRLGP